MMLSLSLLALCLITTAKGQFHRDCSTQDALSTRRCCPVFDGSECGSGSGRGSCQRYQLQDPNITDTRCNWPYQQYDEICSCNGNYDGPDCGDCKPYYHGPTCSEYIPCVRKELRELTTAEKKQFVDTLCLAKTTTSTRWVAQTGGSLGDVSTYTFENLSEYDCIVTNHANCAIYVKVGSDWNNQDVLHSGPAFGPGHRCLLMRFERMLQQISGNKSMCLPYWDWTQDGNNCDVCTDELMGRVGTNGSILAPSCFATWRTVCNKSDTHSFCRHDPVKDKRPLLTRNIGLTKTWPKKTQVEQCVSNWKQYDSVPFTESTEGCFRPCLEGSINPSTGKADGTYMHNKCHVEIGGDMGWLTRASNDPLFYVHHCQVDRIFAKWQWVNCKTPADYPKNDAPCMGPDDAVYPAMPRRTLKDCMKTPAEFGYSYSDFNTWPVQGCSAISAAAAPTTTTTTTTTATTTTTTTTTERHSGLLSWLGK